MTELERLALERMALAANQDHEEADVEEGECFGCHQIFDGEGSLCATCAYVVVDEVPALIANVRELEAQIARTTDTAEETAIALHDTERDQIAGAIEQARTERLAVICWLLDRGEQYPNSSGYRAFVEELIDGIAEGRHVTCMKAGEYDDLKDRAETICQRGEKT